MGYMANLCIKCYLNKRGEDDRDHWGSKRLQLAGSLLHDLFRRCFTEFQGVLAREIQSKRLVFDILRSYDLEKNISTLKNIIMMQATRSIS